MKLKRLAILAAVIALVAAFFIFDLGRFLNIEALKQRQAELTAYREAHPLLMPALFFALYVAVTGLSLPGAGLLTIAAGAIFGLVLGTVIVSFASSVGATLAFLVSRFLLRDAIQKRYGEKLRTVNAGIEREGGFYLFSLRLVPAFPYVLVNLIMGVTPIKVWTFYWVSQIGMLAGTLVFVFAGTGLAKIQSARDILTPTLIGAFVLLGLFPLLAKKVLEKINARRAAKV
jgi:uncharacterized membrane protein YdjX (TVP38/TMEM64 family)